MLDPLCANVDYVMGNRNVFVSAED